MDLQTFLLILSLFANGGLVVTILALIKRIRAKSVDLAYSKVKKAEFMVRAAIALEGAELGVWEWDIAADRFTVSERSLTMLGLENDDVGETYLNWQKRIHTEDLPVKSAKLQDYLDNLSGRFECEYRIRHKEGHWVWVMDRGRLLDADASERNRLMVGTFLDITHRKDMEQQLLQLARTDPLTGLFNRRVFQERLQMEWHHYKRKTDQQLAVAICDIDHFKRINDNYGHSVGDAVLKHFSSLLAGSIREYDLSARIGGEEFAILLKDASIGDARAWAERFRQLVAESALQCGNIALTYTVSIGLAQFDVRLASPDEVVKKADNALYQAKRNGRNQIATVGTEN